MKLLLPLFFLPTFALAGPGLPEVIPTHVPEECPIVNARFQSNDAASGNYSVFTARLPSGAVAYFFGTREQLQQGQTDDPKFTRQIADGKKKVLWLKDPAKGWEVSGKSAIKSCSKNVVYYYLFDETGKMEDRHSFSLDAQGNFVRQWLSQDVSGIPIVKTSTDLRIEEL